MTTPKSIAPDDQAAGLPSSRSRDKPNEVRARILRAAQVLFGERGYSGTNTRDLAAAAGVAERTLFRQFGTKANLFQAAVIAPFHDFVDDYVRQWEERPKGERDASLETFDFYSGVFHIMRENRNLVLALASVRAFEEDSSELFPQLTGELAGLLTRLEKIVAYESELRGFILDPGITARLMFGTILASTVFGDWMFADGEQPGSELMLTELTAFTVYGLSARPSTYRKTLDSLLASEQSTKHQRSTKHQGPTPR
jgi:AcrR family transcriptional regulator